MRIVQKYGGSSVADIERLTQVAERIARSSREGHQLAVVVSAMGNTTNELIALAQATTASPDRRELDMLISVGERISMSLLAMKLQEMGVDAQSLTGSQSGIITNESHADARVVEVRPDRVAKLLDEGKVVIVAGFQGVSRAREVTTLGRGGSDTTAVVLAAALKADYCEICSDVDGVWSADPRVVTTAARIDELSLDEGLALARGGAKVLFEDALRYARDEGVTLRATATHGPGAGTRLVSTRPARSGAVAVTSDSQLRAIDVSGASEAAIVEALLTSGARLRRRLGPVLHIDLRNAHGGLDVPEGARDLGSIAVVTAVGTCLGESSALQLEGFHALADLACLDRGASGDAAWWQVRPEDEADATARIHDALVDLGTKQS
jgi:aspartate kinase